MSLVTHTHVTLTSLLLLFFRHQVLITFLVSFLNAPAHMKSPYLRQRLVEVLRDLLPDQADPEPASLTALPRNRAALEHLPVGLLRFYVEIERTGRSSQFYNKFSARYQVREGMIGVHHVCTDGSWFMIHE